MTLTELGFTVETSGVYTKSILKTLQMEECNPSAIPGRSPSDKELEEAVELDPDEAAVYRTCVGKSIYASLDRLDIQYAVKNLAKGMRAPQDYHMKNLKLLTRYLRGRPTAVYVYGLENVPAFINTNVDSDWAGEKPGRRSTSGGGV